MKDAVRYSVVFDRGEYAEGAQRLVDHLVTERDDNGQPRYEPVKFKNKWDSAEGYVGINSFWRDSATGQVFEVQIHTHESFVTTKETHGLLETMRDTTDPTLADACQVATNEQYARVPRPPDATAVDVPASAWPDGHPPEPTAPTHPEGDHAAADELHDRGDDPSYVDHTGPVPGPRLVTDAEAVQLVRDNVHQTPSGYSFYPDGDRMLPFAESVQSHPGTVNLDLHGSPHGFHIEGRVLTAEQFAHAIDVLRQEGRIQIGPGDQVRLLSCDVGRGDDSPAQQFARASGLEVRAPTERLWSNLRGEEIVSSAQFANGRWVPTHPPDGHWRTFSSAGEVAGGPGPHEPGRPGTPGTAPRGLVDADHFAGRASDDPAHPDQSAHHDQQHDRQHEGQHHDDPAPTPDHDSPHGTEEVPEWNDVERLLPSDDSGYRVTPDDCEFLGIDPEEVANWAIREAPLGMTPEQFGEFRDGLFDGLRTDGLTPDQVDVRLQGSSANFFSGAHKTLPTADEITNPEALRRYEEWRGDATDHPLRRPFDSMYRLTLDHEPSDYDVQISSDAMIAQAELVRQQSYPDVPLLSRKYGFLDKDVARDAFPGLYEWAKQQSQALGRPVVPAIFPSAGPPDHSATSPVSAHFRDTDWRLQPPEGD